MIHHIAPCGSRRLDTQSQEGDVGLCENYISHAECGRDDDRAKRIGHQIAKEDALVISAQRFGSRNIIQFLQRKHVGAHDTSKVHP